ncbi:MULTISPECIES: hypothetical protein [Deinococcus]|uniref:hypothetical protein n=1 Tax=Deinococcus TaxID=1298 RepID=UPI0004850954|nr:MULTISPECIES: hypothetical protein [Deinococcus]KEF33623.1 hypothetical protein RDMS_11630 [Deinococcus sp. RL]
MRLAGALLLAGLGLALAVRAPATELTLRPAFGGAVLQGRVNVGGADELTGVWSGAGRARLLRCTPRCETVESIPVPGTLPLGENTPYRVVLAGEFRPGQKVRLTLRFRQAPLLNTEATPVRP